MHGWKILSSLSLLMLAYPVTLCLSLWKESRREKGFTMHFIMYAWVHEILPFSWEKIHGFYARPSMTRHLFYIDLHLEEHFFLLTSLIPTWVQRSNIFLLYEYMCSKTGPSFKNYFWYFYTDSMLGSQTARPISSLFIEYNKHCAIT